MEEKRTITITYSGSTTEARMTFSGEDGRVWGVGGVAKCSPEDKFDPYEGARIALARAFNKDPFQEKKEEDGKWVHAMPYAAGAVGDQIRVDTPILSLGRYNAGEKFRIKRADTHGCWVRSRRGDAYLRFKEYSIWTPNKHTSAVQKGKEKKPEFCARFKVGDVVRLNGMIFIPSCRGQIGRITKVSQFGNRSASYTVSVVNKSGERMEQSFPDSMESALPRYAELLWRDEP